MNHKDSEYYYSRMASLGSLYALDLRIDESHFLEELERLGPQWVPYNKSKQWSARFGLSLFSLDGGTSGEIDLNSVREWNVNNGTKYNELSFNKPTPYWKHFESISNNFLETKLSIGRSHLLRLDAGGAFPPHRDNYLEGDDTFRIISFLNTSPDVLHFVVDGRLQSFQAGAFYYLDTRKVHSLMSYRDDSTILVMNIKLDANSWSWVCKNLSEK